ncbi:MAG TPA: hypothetical protein VMT18_03030 [Planctomycetota bacterium]|nr:hypothetical protein [Planctomycetota bacterium]
MAAPSRLRALPATARTGLTGLVLSLVLGLWASLAHLEEHHQNRDGAPGVSLDDLTGAYHGLDRPAALVLALERGHPEGLAASERKLLLDWLGGGKVSEQYDDLELGDFSPAEVIGRGCLDCHARQSGVAAAAAVPLEYWDDVARVAFSRSLEATPRAILVTSLHTHATSLAVLSLVVLALLWATRWSRGTCGALAAVCGVALVVDLACQLLARDNVALVLGVAAGGALWGIALGLACALVLLDLWLPAKEG